MGATLHDLAPTILHYLGLPVPAGMDGQVVGALLAPELAGHPVERCEDDDAGPLDAGLAGADEEEIEERLRGLGYL